MQLAVSDSQKLCFGVFGGKIYFFSTKTQKTMEHWNKNVKSVSLATSLFLPLQNNSVEILFATKRLISKKYTEFERNEKMKKMAIVLVVSLVFVSGCIIVGNSVEPDKFNPGRDTNKVGGGFNITYLAPEDGTVHLMDRKSGKSILSQSISAGNEFKFSAAEQDITQYKKWGINIDKADFVLYFYPKHPKPQPPAHFMPIQEDRRPLPADAPLPPQ